MSRTREQLEAWLKTIGIKDGSLVVDVGGSQKPVQPRLGNAGKDSEYTILDLPKPHEVAVEPFLTMDLNEDWEGQPDEFDESAGVVFCLEVMEYVWNPYQALKNIEWLLQPRGKLFLSVPFVYPVHNPKENDYLRYTDTGISKLLEKAGFEIDEIIPRNADSANTLLEAFYDTEGMKPSRSYKEHDSVGWLIEATKKKTVKYVEGYKHPDNTYKI